MASTAYRRSFLSIRFANTRIRRFTLVLHSKSRFIMTNLHIAFIELMTITGLMIALVISRMMMMTRMRSIISLIMMRLAKIKMLHIMIYIIYTEQPLVRSRINRTIKIFHAHKPTILRRGKNPAQIFVTIIQTIIIAIQCIGISPYHIVHDITHAIDEIIIHFIHIIILHRAQVKFVCHSVCQETSVFTHLAHAHCTHRRYAYGQHQNHQPKRSQLFHILFFLLLSIFLIQK